MEDLQYQNIHDAYFAMLVPTITLLHIYTTFIQPVRLDPFISWTAL